MEVIYFIGYACLAVLLTSMTKPIEDLKKLLGIHYSDDSKYYIKRFIRDLLNCEYCFAFWLGIILYQHIAIAAILSILANILYKYLNGIK